MTCVHQAVWWTFAKGPTFVRSTLLCSRSHFTKVPDVGLAEPRKCSREQSGQKRDSSPISPLFFGHMQDHFPLIIRPFAIHLFNLSDGCFHGFIREGHHEGPKEDLNVQQSSRAPRRHSSGCHCWLYLSCNINGCSDQPSTKVFHGQLVVLCSIPLNGRFMRNDTEETLHGDHREEGAVGTRWKLLLHSTMCTQCRTESINFFAINLIFAHLSDCHSIMN